jgi:glutamate/tyrosine decarboxylase-like PLP-dependent enzyme
MRRPDWNAVLARAAQIAGEFYARLPERAVPARADATAMVGAFDRPLPVEGAEPVAVIDELARLADPGLTMMPSGRFFGWVIGGGLPAAVAADWLTSVWDQNCGSVDATPAGAVIEHVVLRWVAELLDLPAGSGALVTGAQMANFVGLAVGRTEVLRRAGWEVEVEGLAGAPGVEVYVGSERHGTIDRALRLLGFGTRQLRVVEADAQGRMRADRLELAGDGPAIVCAQLGNVNGGGCDALADITARIAKARQHRPVWLHVDGAFGLWARATAGRRALAGSAELADSWATDAHKWLNTPYDCGISLVRDAAAHRRTFHGGATYLPGESVVPNPFDHTPELSRRARGFALWAALRQLGRGGVGDLVERCCAYTAQLAEGLARLPGVEIMNEVVLNQLVVRFRDPAGRDDDAHTRAVLARVVGEGVCMPSGTTWRGVAAMRLSLSNWSTDADDIAQSLASIARAHEPGSRLG